MSRVACVSNAYAAAYSQPALKWGDYMKSARNLVIASTIERVIYGTLVLLAVHQLGGYWFLLGGYAAMDIVFKVYNGHRIIQAEKARIKMLRDMFADMLRQERVEEEDFASRNLGVTVN